MNLSTNETEEILKQKECDIELKKQNILIDTGMLIHENINMNKMPKVSKKLNNEYSFDMKFFNLISGLSITNELICKSNLLFNQIKNNTREILIFNSYSFTKLQKLNEYIVYDLKKYIDEVISITWLLKQAEKVEDISIHNIGSYLNNSKNGDYTEYDNFKDFFEKINDLDNAYKHSYTNSAVAPNIGTEKNYIVVYYSKYGKKIRKPEIVDIELDELINKFNDFYNYSFELIENLGSK